VSVIPTHLEAAFSAARILLRNKVPLIVIDSLTGFECAEDANNYNVGERARFAKSLSVLEGLGELYDEARKNKALIVVTNQLRTPIGSLNPKPTSALRRVIGQVTNTRIQTFKEQVRNEYGELAYAKIRFHVKKSLKSPPNRKAWGFLFNQRGFDPGFELLRDLLQKGLIELAGSYFRLPDGTTIGPGYETAAIQINQKLADFRSYHETI
jgi:RecA/RadA recombinase